MRMKNRSAFAEIMRNARRSADISQAAVAEALGMAVSYISDVESDKRFPPKSAAIIKWARMVGVDPAEAIVASGRPFEVYGDAEVIRAAMREFG